MKFNPSKHHSVPLIQTLLCAMLCTHPTSHAQDAERAWTPEEVPAPLKPWVPWALDRAPVVSCVNALGAERCVWPGQLTIDASRSEGTFTQVVIVDRNHSSIALPGNAQHYPLGIKVNGKNLGGSGGNHEPTLIVNSDPPELRLPAGTHTITGRFSWTHMPETLPIPPNTANVKLNVNGKPLSHPRRDADGTLWLGQSEMAQSEVQSDRLSVETYRQIQDGSPLSVVTFLRLEVSGRPREITLSNVLLAGTVPTEATSNLPLHVENNGATKIQVRAGVHELRISALYYGALTSLSLPKVSLSSSSEQDANAWPQQEVWTWSNNEQLRQLEVQGNPIDPNRTNLPAEWKGQPTFLLEAASDTLTFKNLRQGEPTLTPNNLTLKRHFILDLNGEGFTVNDAWNGTLNGPSDTKANPHQSWRLAMMEGDLGRVAANTPDNSIPTDQLITVKDKLKGVELRRSDLSMTADSRLKRHSTMTVNTLKSIGWAQDIANLSATLSLPPGWSLLHASGPDHVTGSWTGKWTLWWFFLVIILAFAVGKIYTRNWILLFAVLLPLILFERDAPVFIWIPLLMLVALANVFPKGTMQKILSWSTLFFFACLVVISLVFAKQQLHFVFHPYTAQGSRLSGLEEQAGGFAGKFEQNDMAPLEATIQQEQAPAAPDQNQPALAPLVGGGGSFGDLEASATGHDADRSSMRTRRTKNASSQFKKDFYAYDNKMILQTGPGMPKWENQTLSLGWNGPVTQEESMKLYLIAPWLNKFLSLLRVALLGWVIVLMARKLPKPSKDGFKSSSTTSEQSATTPVVTLGILMLASSLAVAFGFAQPAKAQTFTEPSQGTLDALRERLMRNPAYHPSSCGEACNQINEMTLSARGRTVDITLSVYAQATSALALPGPIQNFAPNAVTLDGKATSAIARLENGFIFLRLPVGTHTVSIKGEMPDANALTLSFLSIPKYLTASAGEFQVEGIDSDGKPQESISLRRLVSASNSSEELDSSSGLLNPFFSIERRFLIHNRWEMETIVSRITPSSAPSSVNIRLLANESLTASDLESKDGVVTLSFGVGETSKSFASVLTPNETMVLSPTSEVNQTETWQLTCGPIWNCESVGIHPLRHQDSGSWRMDFMPFPGDKLTLKFSKPEAAAGISSTIDNARLEVTPGARITHHALSLSLRTSTGGTHSMGLPKGIKLKTIRINGENKNLQSKDNATETLVDVSLSPGAHEVFLEWESNDPWQTTFRTPKIGLNHEGVNAHIVIKGATDSRWILWLDGSSWGPHIFFWKYVVLILLIAFGLSRIPKSPLRFLEWALLGLGLVQLPALAMWIVPAWFFFMAQRKELTALSSGAHVLMQIIFLGLTLGALITLYACIHMGLLVQPDMNILPYSYEGLTWYMDRFKNFLPTVFIISVPTWVYKTLMFIWSLWLARKMLDWAKTWWTAFNAGGILKASPIRAAPAKPASGDSPQTPSSKSLDPLVSPLKGYTKATPIAPASVSEAPPSETAGKEESTKTE